MVSNAFNAPPSQGYKQQTRPTSFGQHPHSHCLYPYFNADKGARICMEQLNESILYRELMEHFKEGFFRSLSKMTGNQSERYTNEQVLNAVLNTKHQNITLFYRRGSGFTTSAIAALFTFPNVVLTVDSSARKAMLLSQYPVLDSECILTPKEIKRKLFKKGTIVITDGLEEIKDSFSGLRLIQGIGIETNMTRYNNPTRRTETLKQLQEV